nr:hypothetical protein CFP56_01474 [Quercus suber]
MYIVNLIMPHSSKMIDKHQPARRVFHTSNVARVDAIWCIDGRVVVIQRHASTTKRNILAFKTNSRAYIIAEAYPQNVDVSIRLLILNLFVSRNRTDSALADPNTHVVVIVEAMYAKPHRPDSRVHSISQERRATAKAWPTYVGLCKPGLQRRTIAFLQSSVSFTIPSYLPSFLDKIDIAIPLAFKPSAQEDDTLRRRYLGIVKPSREPKFGDRFQGMEYVRDQPVPCSNRNGEPVDRAGRRLMLQAKNLLSAPSQHAQKSLLTLLPECCRVCNGARVRHGDHITSKSVNTPGQEDYTAALDIWRTSNVLPADMADWRPSKRCLPQPPPAIFGIQTSLAPNLANDSTAIDTLLSQYTALDINEAGRRLDIIPSITCSSFVSLLHLSLTLLHTTHNSILPACPPFTKSTDSSPPR